MPVRWKTLDSSALTSRVQADQQVGFGGLVTSPELALRSVRDEFPGPLPKFGERIEVDGATYRIAKVGNHPRSPLVTLSLTSTDE